MIPLTKLTEEEVSEICPTQCSMLRDSGLLIIGGLQGEVGGDTFPSDHDIEREGQRVFGAVKLAATEDEADSDTVTWIFRLA